LVDLDVQHWLTLTDIIGSLTDTCGWKDLFGEIEVFVCSCNYASSEYNTQTMVIAYVFIK